LLLFPRFAKIGNCLVAPEQTAHSAQKPGEFGQWLGSMFTRRSV
jgi:hypothetical protein